jgi:lipopolysaccharide transport system permease protein
VRPQAVSTSDPAELVSAPTPEQEAPQAGSARQSVAAQDSELWFSDRAGLLGALREVWSHRELLFFLTWRDVKVRYKQTALGVLWALIQPLLTMAIFTVIFGRIAHISTDGVPRPVFYFSGLLPWLYLSSTVTQASMSLVTNYQLLTKIYFPRIMLPAGTALSGLVDFFVGSSLLIGFFIYYHIHPSWGLLLWPVLVLQMILLGLAVSLVLATLNVKFRDVKYAIPFMVQIWMFTTPVIYPVSIIPARFRFLVAFNPATGLIDAFRHSLDPVIPLEWSVLGISTAVTLALFVGAVAFFHRSERAFADII